MSKKPSTVSFRDILKDLLDDNARARARRRRGVSAKESRTAKRDYLVSSLDNMLYYESSDITTNGKIRLWKKKRT